LIKTHSRKTNAPEEEPVTIDTTDLLMTYNVNTDKKTHSRDTHAPEEE